MEDTGADIIIKFYEKPIAFYWRMSQRFEEINSTLDFISHMAHLSRRLDAA